MKIKQLHLIKYKRFFDLTIDFGDSPKRIVALVGPNGCGKSSVFDAMLFLANDLLKIGNGNAKDHKYHSLGGDFVYRGRNVRIQFDKGSFEDVQKTF